MRVSVIYELFSSLGTSLFRIVPESIKRRWPNRLLPRRDLTIKSHHFKLQIPSPQHSFVARELYITGQWEPEVTRAIFARIKPGMSFVDVGAHIGYFAVLAGHSVGHSGRVIAFEPDCEAFKYLRQNIVLNELSNTQAVPFALADIVGKAELGEKGQMNSTDCTTKASIETKIFDRVREDFGLAKVDLVKIDVEGAEILVLRGMRQTLLQDQPVIVLEIHPDFLPRFSATTSDVLEFLKSIGYLVAPINRCGSEWTHGPFTVVCNPAAPWSNLA